MSVWIYRKSGVIVWLFPTLLPTLIKKSVGTVLWLNNLIFNFIIRKMWNKHWQWIRKPRCRQEFLQSHHCFSISSLNLSLAFNTCFIFFCDTFMTMTQLIHQRREVEESLKQKMERQTNWDSVHFYSVKSFWPFQFSISTSSFTILSGPGPM